MGVIVVSVETAMNEAPRHGNSVPIEIMLYAIHGVLHLCGYDDRTPRHAQRMRRRQTELLNRIIATENTESTRAR
jgi:probable rRNA maturation factor